MLSEYLLGFAKLKISFFFFAPYRSKLQQLLYESLNSYSLCSPGLPLDQKLFSSGKPDIIDPKGRKYGLD